MSTLARLIGRFTRRLEQAVEAPPTLDWTGPVEMEGPALEAALYPPTEPGQFEPLSNTSGVRCLVCKRARAIFRCRWCDVTVCVECDCCPDVLEVQP